MTRIRRFKRGLVVAVMIAACLVLGTSTADAKKPGGGQEAVCTYLLSIINYPNVNPYIQAWAVNLYTTLGCVPALP
jgi:hypothetical protein